MTVITYTKPPHNIGAGDNVPPLIATLSFPPGTSATVLVGATVTIDIWDPATGAMVQTDAACTILDTTLKRVQYNWQTGDTANATGVVRSLHARFHIVTATAQRYTDPNDDSVMLILVAPAHD